MDVFEKTKRFYQGVNAEKEIIGNSFLGREIYAVKIGEGLPVGIAQYAIHGREFITAELALAHYHRGIYQGSVWLIPLANPDGALLSQCGLGSVGASELRKRLLAWNHGSEDFSLWKANARGVDLNVNFPARWGKGAKNTRMAGAENYIGAHPFSERETQALRDFTLKVKPNYTVSYHTKGEEIYWYFYQSLRTCPRDKALAEVISVSTGYSLGDAGESAGGYKDWCIQRLNIPSFTVEAGKEELSHPIREAGLTDIIEKNKNALYDVSKAYGRLWAKD